MAYVSIPAISRGLCCLACAALIAAGGSAGAADGVLLPPAPNGPGGEDSITTSQGVKCAQSINSNSGYVDLGVTGGGALTIFGGGVATTPTTLAYARVVLPFGEQPKRLNCNHLYELEIERLKREIDLLTIGLE